jgi:hypothetical protein
MTPGSHAVTRAAYFRLPKVRWFSRLLATKEKKDQTTSGNH